MGSSNSIPAPARAPTPRRMRPAIPAAPPTIVRKSLENFAKDNNMQEILDKKLCDFWINTSHNTFLANWQVGGEARVSNLSKALENGARCIELDIENTILGPSVSHAGVPGHLKDYLQIVMDDGFKNTNDPLIIYLEISNSGNESHMQNVGSLLGNILGPRLYEGRFNIKTKENYCFNVPIKKLLGKIVLVMNYYNMSAYVNGVNVGWQHRWKYLDPYCHATANDPDNGSVDNKSESDKKRKENPNQVVRVYPNNILTSGNFDPTSYWTQGSNMVALNFGNDDKYLKINTKKFQYCSFMPIDIIMSPTGKVQKPLYNVFTWDPERIAPIYDNIIAENHIIMPNKCYTNGSTWRSDDNKHFLRMQSDGNLVIYDNNNKAKWNSGTSGNPNAILHMQKDGNLVIYNSSGDKILWSSGTNGIHGGYATLTDDDFDIFDWEDDKVKRIY
jgi:hypothetical protein